MTHLLNFGMAAWMLHEILVKAQQLLQLTWVLNFTQLCMVLATDIYLLKRDFDFVLLMEGKVELK